MSARMRSRMRRRVGGLALVALLLLGTGMLAWGRLAAPPGVMLPEERLSLTTAAQDAVFFVTSGWIGGLGSMPVLDKDGRVKSWGGKELWLDEAAVDEIMSRAKLAKVNCSKGRPGMVVSANIELLEAVGFNQGVAPERRQPQPYYKVKINEIYEVC